jgi:hypothetical protein
MMNPVDRGFRLTEQAIGRQLAAMPYGLYLVRLIHHRTRRPLPGERLWTPAQLLHSTNIKFLRIRNRDGFDVYIRPDNWDQNAGFILLDLDRPDDGVLHRMRDNGHDPCVVLETSPGRLQAWIRVTTSGLESFYATAIARRLAHQYHGDPASADWRHMGRLAGFTNQKPERRTIYGYAPWVRIVHARAGLAPGAEALIQSAGNALRYPCHGELGRRLDSTATSVDPARAGQMYQNLLRQWRIAQRFSCPDWSIVDLWVARRLLGWGLPPDQVEDVIRLGSPQFPRRHGNPGDYLRRTLARAAFPFPPKGGPV